MTSGVRELDIDNLIISGIERPRVDGHSLSCKRKHNFKFDLLLVYLP